LLLCWHFVSVSPELPLIIFFMLKLGTKDEKFSFRWDSCSLMAWC
jgi:hypothetical protein